MKVFLGGTCNGSEWRSMQALAQLLVRNGAHVYSTLEQAAEFINNYKI